MHGTITARKISRHHPVEGKFTRRCTKRIPYGKSLHEKEYVRIPPKFYKYRRRDADGVESFWALLKRGYYGTFHHMSPKHLRRYVNEFSTRHNLGHDTFYCLNAVTDGMIGRRLTYERLTA